MNRPFKRSALLQHKIENIPTQPGVYLYKNNNGSIIYIGKAINLRNRVRSYFSGQAKDIKTQRLVKNITDIEWIIVANELEALVLEATLIKKHKPRYNIHLKDDKQYPYLKLTAAEYPRFIITRRRVNDGGIYFGPYTTAKSIRHLLEIIRRIFPLVNCARELHYGKTAGKPCLYYQIRQCGLPKYGAPCMGTVPPDVYKELIQEVLLFIRGKHTALITTFTEKMKHYSDTEQFESAAFMRDRLESIKNMQARQRVVSQRFLSQDVIAYAHEGTLYTLSVFQMREGKIIGRSHFIVRNPAELNYSELMEGFLTQYYESGDSIPEEIILPAPMEDAARTVIAAWLTAGAGHRVRIRAPRSGEGPRLVKLAQVNAEMALNEFLIARKTTQTGKQLKELQIALDLPVLPETIECFDISHTQGGGTVGAMVYFKNGKPDKNKYRKFHIKSHTNNDDVASMREVIARRYQRLANDKKEFPALIVIDGGKGQLRAAYEILHRISSEQHSIIGLAKKNEEIFLPGQSKPIVLAPASSALKLLQAVRDEAHRCAVTFHRTVRRKKSFYSSLDRIPGIGKKRKNSLLKRFGSLEKITAASISDLTTVSGITKIIAEKIKNIH